MAVLPRVPGLTATICVGGEPLKEYIDDEEQHVADDNSAEHRTVSHYIESASDKEYTVKVDVDPTFNFDCPALLIIITIDGKIRTSEYINKSDVDSHLPNAVTKVASHIRINVQAARGQSARTYLQAFRFAKIVVDETKQDSIKHDTARMKGVGEIHMEIYRASEGIPCPASFTNDISLSKAHSVHEKALKGQAKSHSTSVRTDVVKPLINYVYHRRLDEVPIVLFKFKYRSEDALKQLMILERSLPSSPVPEETAANHLDLEGLTVKQKLKLNNFLQELTGKTNGPQATKREPEDDNKSGPRKRRSGRKTTIDLTAEDSD